MATLYGLVLDSVECDNGKVAVVFDDGEHSTSVTYQQLWNLSSKVMEILSNHVGDEEVVGVCLKTSHLLPVVLIGILRLDIAFYSFDWEGFQYAMNVINVVGARTLIVHKDYMQALTAELQTHNVQIKAITDLDFSEHVVLTLCDVRRVCHPARLAYCITTSGTTGSPKIVRVPHRCIVPNILHLSEIFNLTPDDFVLCATTLTFDPSIVEIFTTLSAGACLLIVPPTVKIIPRLFIEVVYHRNKVTVMQMTPSVLYRLKGDHLKQTILGDKSSVRVVALGGEKFPACDWLKKCRSANNKTTFFNLYGTTEISCWATCYKVTEEDISNNREIPLGECLRDTVIQVVDSYGQTISVGTGHLLIGGTLRQCILDGGETGSYDVTKLQMRDTGDLVRLDNTGCIFYLGRQDSQLKRNGKRINLEELKMVTSGCRLVQSCEAIMVSDKLVIAVVIENNASGDMKADIVKYVHTRLPSHWWPDDVFILQNMPVNKHGKVDVQYLASMYTASHVKVKDLDVSSLLKTQWKELLQTTGTVQETSNFIITGGNSLKAVHLANDLENQLNTQLPLLLDLLLTKTFSDVKHYVISVLERKKMSNFDFHNNFGISKDTGIAAVDKGTSKTTDPGLGRLRSTCNKNSHEIQPYQDKICTDNSMHNYTEADYVHVEKRRKLSTLFRYSISRCNKKFKVGNFNHDGRLASNACNKSVKDIISTRFKLSTENSQNTTDSEDLEHVSNNSLENNSENAIKTMPTAIWNEPVESGGNTFIGENIEVTQSTVQIKLKHMWKYDTKKCVDASPLIAASSTNRGSSTVYIGSHSHIFTAITMATGLELWETTLPDRIESSACLSHCGNYVVVGCYDGHVYTLCSETGDIHWKFDTEGQVKSSPVVDNVTGHVYIGSHSQLCYCLDVQTRCVVWEANLSSGSVFSSPTVCYQPHCVYVATLGGKLFSLDTISGSVIWQYNLLKPVFSSPTVTPLDVCVGCTDQYLWHFNHQGSVIWRYKTNGPIFSSPSFTPNIMMEKTLNRNSTSETGKIIVGSHDCCLYCVAMETGQLIWKIQADAPIYSSPFPSIITLKTLEHIARKENEYSEEIERNSDFSDSKDEKELNSFKYHNDEQTTSMPENMHARSNIKGQSFNENPKIRSRLKISSKAENMDKDSSCAAMGSAKSKHVDYKKDLDIVAFANTTGTVFVADASCGRILCEEKLGGEIFSSPLVVNNKLVVGCRDDFVYCLELVN